MTQKGPGRPRDETIDERVLAEARSQLAAGGYEGLSVARVADASQTSRQAVYRRWSSKADLATAAIAAMSQASSHKPSGDDFVDLVAELEAFRRGISRPDGLAMIGTMLLTSTDQALVSLFRQRIVEPRRSRLRAILVRARDDARLDRDADIDIAVSTFTGSWYSIALAGDRAPKDWSLRIATLVWRALGGSPA